MKTWLLLAFGLITVWMLVGCEISGLPGGAMPRPSAPPTATSVPAATGVSPSAPRGTSTSSPVKVTQTPTQAPTPDLASMTFVEKNDLFLRLLTDRQAEGADTTAAEEAYVRSLEATLAGNTLLADQYLSQAILLLWR